MIDIQPGRSEQSLANFYEDQPDSIVSNIEVVSMDVSKAYTGATRTHAPQATICYDPFHLMQWVNRALDRVYAEAATGPGRAAMSTPNALIEGIDAKIRLINARGYGHHSAQTLASMIYLCLGGLQVKLPART